jgi:hypothetical protein
MRDLRRVVIDDVGLVRVQCRVILMVGFRRIKGLQRHYLGHDGAGEHFGFVELRDVGLRNLLLLLVAIENHRPVLAAFIRSLPV